MSLAENVVFVGNELASRGFSSPAFGIFTKAISADCSAWVMVTGNDYLFADMIGILCPAVNRIANRILRRFVSQPGDLVSYKLGPPLCSATSENLCKVYGVPPLVLSKSAPSLESARVAARLLSVAERFCLEYPTLDAALGYALEHNKFGEPQKYLVPTAATLLSRQDIVDEYVSAVMSSIKSQNVKDFYHKFVEMLASEDVHDRARRQHGSNGS